MKFVIRERGEGKTTTAVLWLLEDRGHRVLLTGNEEMASLLRKRHGLSDKEVMSARAAGTRLRGRRNVTVAVDDLDMILASLLHIGGGHCIEMVTATGTTITREDGHGCTP